MKKIITVLACTGLTAVLHAQRIEVTEAREDIGGGTHNALVVPVYGVEAKEVEKAWKSKMKDYGAKVSNSKGEWYGNNAVIKDMTPKFIDIYARVEDKKEEVKLIVAVDLGGAFLNSSDHRDKYKVMERIMHDFAYSLTKDALDYQAKTQQKALDKLNGQEKDLVKENTNLNNQIVEYQNKIKKDQDELQKNKTDQDSKQKEIAQQQKVVEEATQKAKSVQ